MKRRIMGLTLSVVMFFCLFSYNVYALDEDAMNKYAKTVVGQYLGLHIINPEGDYYVSQGYEIYNADDQSARVYFVFNNDVCIGKLSVTYFEGEYVSSYIHYSYDAITELLRNNEDFLLFRQKEQLFCCSDTLMISINDNVYMEAPATKGREIKEVKLKLERVNITNLGDNSNAGIMLASDYGSSLTSSYGILQVPIVENLKIDGYYHCWAACVASYASYTKNIAELDTYDVHYDMKTTYYKKYGYPEGTLAWIDRAFKYYGVDITRKKGGLNFDGVKSVIQQNRPIYAIVDDAADTKTHAVLICGYQSVQGGYYYYTIMDPNAEEYVTVQTTSSSTSKKFTFVSDGVTFSKWEYRYY